MKEFLSHNTNRLMAATGVCSALALAGCASDPRPNYEGAGNNFEILAQVDHTGKYSVTLDAAPEKVLIANGKAVGWFNNGSQHQVHNHYKIDKGSDCEHKVFVGHESDEIGQTIELPGLKTGDEVQVEGFISESSIDSRYGCDTEDRPVFTSIKIVHIPFEGLVTGQ